MILEIYMFTICISGLVSSCIYNKSQLKKSVSELTENNNRKLFLLAKKITKANNEQIYLLEKTVLNEVCKTDKQFYSLEQKVLEVAQNNTRMCNFLFEKIFEYNFNYKNRLQKNGKNNNTDDLDLDLINDSDDLDLSIDLQNKLNLK